MRFKSNHRFPAPKAFWPMLGALALLLIFIFSPNAEARVLEGLQGDQFDTETLSQGDHIVVIWASWSPKCRSVVPRINEIHQEWSGSAQVVSINFEESSEKARDFLKGKGLLAPTYLDSDGSFSKEYRITNLPGLLLIHDGEEAFRGAMPRDALALIKQTFQ